MVQRQVRFLVFASGERFRVSLWLPRSAEPRGGAAAERRGSGVLLFESDDWQGAVETDRSDLADFSRDELRRLYLRARSGNSLP